MMMTMMMTMTTMTEMMMIDGGYKKKAPAVFSGACFYDRKAE